MGDSRFELSDRYIWLHHNREIRKSFKIGLPVVDGWAAYINGGHMFVKKYSHIIGERYPDFCSSYETYLTDRYIEMETLSPIKILKPGETLEHKETWFLYNNVDTPLSEANADNIREFLINEEAVFL
jgi:hypothetical protein